MTRPLRLAVGLALAAASLAFVADAFADTVITRLTSPGGLPFRYVHMPEDTHQTLAFAWKDGSAVTLSGKEALAILGPALIMEGSKEFDRSAMHEALRDLQASIGLVGTTNVVRGHLSAPPAKFAAAAKILARLLAEPALPEERLAELRKSRAAASRQAYEDAETQAQRLLTRLILGDGPYFRILTAEPAIFERIEVADIEVWRRNILVRDGLVIVAAGPMDAGQAGAEIDRIFAALPPSGNLPAPPKPTTRASGKLVVLERPVVQTAIAAAGPTGFAVTPDIVRAELAVTAFSGGFYSRLYRAVRERLGAAYGISTSLQSVDLNLRGLLIHTAVANDKARDALAAIRAEYARLLADGLTAEEVDPVRTRFATQNSERQRRAPQLAPLLLTLSLYDFPDDFLPTYEARVRSHQLAAINADIRAKFPAPPLTTVVVAPSADGYGADCVIKAREEIMRCE